MNNDAAAGATSTTTNPGYAILRSRLPLTRQGAHNSPAAAAAKVWR